MKKKLTIQQRLILPIILLGAVAILSNALSVFGINNVNFNASKIVDNYMVGSETLQNIRHTTTNIHKMALSHIVATDYNTMITVVADIKEEEKILDIRIILQKMKKRSIHSFLQTTIRSNTPWSILYAQVQTAIQRTPTLTPTVT